MSLFFNSITWPWKTRPMLRLKPEYYVLFSETPAPHVFRLGMYSSESKLTPVFPSKDGLDAYMKHQHPYPTNLEYGPISVGDAERRGLKIKWPYALVVPDKGKMPRYMRNDAFLMALLGRTGRTAR